MLKVNFPSKKPMYVVLCLVQQQMNIFLIDFVRALETADGKNMKKVWKNIYLLKLKLPLYYRLGVLCVSDGLGSL